jgi:hypothetical protein
MANEIVIAASSPSTPAPTTIAGALTSTVWRAGEPRSNAVLGAYRQRGWLRFGVGGLALWAVAVGVTLWTNDSILLPTVVLLGSFVVPLTWLVRRIELAVKRDHAVDLPLPLILRTFVYGGVMGILSSALLETWLLRFSGQAFYIGVGLIEEAVKLVVLWWLTRRLPAYSMVNGMILGASVGFGFAAFESSVTPSTPSTPQPGPLWGHWSASRRYVASSPPCRTACGRQSRESCSSENERTAGSG